MNDTANFVEHLWEAQSESTFSSCFQQWPRAVKHLARNGIVFDEQQKRTILSDLLNGTEKGAQPLRSTAALVADCKILLNVKSGDCSFVIDEALAVSTMIDRGHDKAPRANSLALRSYRPVSSRTFAIMRFWRSRRGATIASVGTLVALLKVSWPQDQPTGV